MKKKMLAAVVATVAVGLFASFATTASATPSKTSRCTSCHSGPNIPITATRGTTTGTNAAYSVSAPGADYIALFNGTTKVTQVAAASGSFTIPVGATYTLYAVAGPGESDGIGSLAVTPAAPVADTAAPVTSSDAKASYVSSAVIKLTATDNFAVTGTYYRLDGGAQTAGTTINVGTVGSHTIEFWSTDAAGNAETHKTATFVITAPVPAPDTTAPQTTSDAKSTYVSSAAIKLSATDNVGVAHTYYTVDGAAQVEGTTINLNTIGSHLVEFWSVDIAGNVESHKTVSFSITAPAPAPTSALTIRSSATTIRSGSTIRLSGVLTPARDDRDIKVYVKKPGSTRWVLLRSDETNDDGYWSVRSTPTTRGTYQFQARYTTSAGTIISNTISVTVTRSYSRD